MKKYNERSVLHVIIIIACYVLSKGVVGVDTIQVIVCEHNSTDLNCLTGYIKILSANYGRKDKTTCPHKSISDTDCHANSSLEKVTNLCSNKTSCKINATNDVFGDPCKNTFKYLNLTYECILDVTTSVAKRVNTDTEKWIAVTVSIFVLIIIIVVLVLLWKRKKFGNCFQILKKKQEQKSFHNPAYDDGRRVNSTKHIYYNEVGLQKQNIRTSNINNDGQNQYDLAKSYTDGKLNIDDSYSYPTVKIGDAVTESKTPFPKDSVKSESEQTEYIEAKFGQYDYLGSTDVRRDTSGKEYNMYSHTLPGNENLKDDTYDKAGSINDQRDIDPCNTYSHTNLS